MTRNVVAAADGSGDITKGIAEVADATRSTNAGVTETEHAAGQLAELSAELERLVARFPVLTSTWVTHPVRRSCSGRPSKVRSMKLAEIRCYPIKSLLGEQLTTAEVDQRGLVGDRLWAVRDTDGKLGSGKNTRRFRRMPGLFTLRGHSGDPVPVVELPDGSRFAADKPAGHGAVSEVLGRRVTIEREAEVMHHDEGPVSLITTAALRRLHDLVGEPVDPVRFRANLLVDVPGRDFPEDGWLGRAVRIGSEVVLRPRRRLTRCVMIDLAQEDAPQQGHLLRTVAEHHDMTFGVWATVERPGRIRLQDAVEVVPA